MSKQLTPDSVTRDQYDEYVRLCLASIEALGINLDAVVLNGIKRKDDHGVVVTVVVPPDDWDGEGRVSSQPDPNRPGHVLTEERYIGVRPARGVAK